MQVSYVSYIRVSTQRQGRSGLGLAAQRTSVTEFLRGCRHKFLQEFVEVESGKRSDRPQLAGALALCRIKSATLIVGKLDRLARNVAFISALMESGVDFMAVDLPQANKLTVHIMAAIAEHEALMISQRTKAALKQSKKKLGGLRWDIPVEVSRAAGRASGKARGEKAAKRAADVLTVVASIQNEGITSMRDIARELNRREVPTARGGQWSGVQVARLFKQPARGG